MSTVDDLSKEILADVVTDFRVKNLGTSDLSEGYVGASIVALEMKHCANGSYSKVDFDLALEQLEESKFVGTGPMVPYENTPGSQLMIMVTFSKREFVYLTEEGYKAAQKSTAKPGAPRTVNALAYITRNGECFEATLESTDRWPNRDGIFYLFRLKDLVKNRGTRLVSLGRFGPKDLLDPQYDSRIEAVRFNALRRAFDQGELSFDNLDERGCKELRLSYSDFQPQAASSDPEVRQFIMHKAYWCFQIAHQYLVQFDSPLDLEYLGVDSNVVRRNVVFLKGKGLLEQNQFPGVSRASMELIEAYEAKQAKSLPTEIVFGPGTPFDGFKRMSEILRSAANEILIVDNYLNHSILDMLLAVSSQPTVKLLTFKPSPDFKIAVAAFQKQYQRPIEVRRHNAEIHDRAIVVDNLQFYALGASIKDMGVKLSVVNRLEDAESMSRLRGELNRIWASALPL
jgi:hypothetical protein